MKTLVAAIAAAFAMFFAVDAMADESESNWYDSVTVFGYVDFRAEHHTLSFADDAGVAELDDDGEIVPGTFDDSAITESDLYVYEAAIGVDVAPNDYVSALVTVAWDEFAFEDGSELFVDEAMICLRYPWTVTPYAVLGRTYPPVGNYATFAISDGLLYTLTETRQTTVGLGASHPYFDASFWLFNGGVDRVDSDGEALDDVVDDWAARVDVFPLAFQEKHELAIGGYYLSDAAETSLEIGEMIGGDYEDNVGLWGAYLYGVFPFTDMVGLGVNVEYASTGRFDEDNYVDAAGDETEITAFLGELAVLVWDQRVSVGARYEFITGIDWLGAVYNGTDTYEPTRFDAVAPFASVSPLDFLRLAAEYRYGYDDEDNKESLFQFQALMEF